METFPSLWLSQCLADSPFLKESVIQANKEPIFLPKVVLALSEQVMKTASGILVNHQCFSRNSNPRWDVHENCKDILP